MNEERDENGREGNCELALRVGNGLCNMGSFAGSIGWVWRSGSGDELDTADIHFLACQCYNISPCSKSLG